MFCPSCGSNLPNEAVFCGHCGARIPQHTAAVPKRTVYAAPVKPQTAESIQRSLLRSPLIWLLTLCATLLAIGMLFSIIDLLTDSIVFNISLDFSLSSLTTEAIAVLALLLALFIGYIVATAFLVTGLWMVTVGGFTVLDRARRGCTFLQAGLTMMSAGSLLLGGLFVYVIARAYVERIRFWSMFATSQAAYDRQVDALFSQIAPVIVLIAVLFIFLSVTCLVLLSFVGSVKHNTKAVMRGGDRPAVYTGGIGAAVMSFITALLLLYVHVSENKAFSTFEPSLQSVTQLIMFVVIGAFAIQHNVFSNKIRRLPKPVPTDDEEAVQV